MEFRVSWLKIDCKEYELLLTPELRVISSLTDISGLYGTPKIDTTWGIWGVRGVYDIPVIRGIRYPNEDGSGERPDAKPCEHYRFVEDGW